MFTREGTEKFLEGLWEHMAGVEESHLGDHVLLRVICMYEGPGKSRGLSALSSG